jgi:tetratricopeptide (TPR) repeat protein
LIKNQAAKKIQHTYKRYITHLKYVQLVQTNALRKVQRKIRGWLMQRLIKKEKNRQQIWTLTKSILEEHQYDYQKEIGKEEEEEKEDVHLTIPTMLKLLGMCFYEQGDYWESASLFERMLKKQKKSKKISRPIRLALANSHHHTWYISYDLYNLQQAKEHYIHAIQPFVPNATTTTSTTSIQRSIIKSTTTPRTKATNPRQRQKEEEENSDEEEEDSIKNTNVLADPYVLLEFATVLMQLNEYKRSLMILGKIIEYFSPEFEFLGKSLLFAGLQLQQIGQYQQSIDYFNLLQEVPPFPYKEFDMMILCAFAYDKMDQKQNCQEGLKSALRMWTLENYTSNLKKNKSQMSIKSSKITTTTTSTSIRRRSILIGSGSGSGCGSGSGNSLTRQLEMIFDLATRSCQEGHYLLSTMCYLYGLKYVNPKEVKKKNILFSIDFVARQWFGFADVMRHLGMISLSQEAINNAKSLHSSMDTSMKNDDVRPVDVFTKELNELTDVMKLQQLVQKQQEVVLTSSCFLTDEMDNHVTQVDSYYDDQQEAYTTESRSTYDSSNYYYNYYDHYNENNTSSDDYYHQDQFSYHQQQQE